METINKKDELVLLIKFIDKEFKKDFENRLCEYGLTAQQGRLLFYISRKNKNNEKVRQVDIEKKYQLTKSTVHGLVERMEKAGLIYKIKDGPNQYIQISEKSESILTLVFEKRSECMDKMLKGVSEEELETLYAILTKIYNNKGGND